MDTKAAIGIGVATAVGLSVATSQLIGTTPTDIQTAEAKSVEDVVEYEPSVQITDAGEFVPPVPVTDDLPTKVEITTEPIELPKEEVAEPAEKPGFFKRVKEKVVKTFTRKKVTPKVAKTAKPKRRYVSRKQPYRPMSFKDLNKKVDGRNIIPEGIHADFSRYKG